MTEAQPVNTPDRFPQGGPAVNAVVKWGRAAAEALAKFKAAQEKKQN